MQRRVRIPVAQGGCPDVGLVFTSSKAILGVPAAPVTDDLLMRPLAVRARVSRS